MSLKNQDSKDKISKESIGKRGSKCDQFPSFSFRYVTSKKQFSFEYFKSDTKGKANALGALSKRLIELSKHPYSYLVGLPKETGCETLEFSGVKITPNDLKIAKDDKVWVFRFKNQNYRIIGVRLDGCPIMHIIGFDFDYSAYNHGS